MTAFMVRVTITIPLEFLAKDGRDPATERISSTCGILVGKPKLVRYPSNPRKKSGACRRDASSVLFNIVVA